MGGPPEFLPRIAVVSASKNFRSKHSVVFAFGRLMIDLIHGDYSHHSRHFQTPRNLKADHPLSAAVKRAPYHSNHGLSSDKTRASNIRYQKSQTNEIICREQRLLVAIYVACDHITTALEQRQWLGGRRQTNPVSSCLLSRNPTDEAKHRLLEPARCM